MANGGHLRTSADAQIDNSPVQLTEKKMSGQMPGVLLSSSDIAVSSSVLKKQSLTSTTGDSQKTPHQTNGLTADRQSHEVNHSLNSDSKIIHYIGNENLNMMISSKPNHATFNQTHTD